LTANLPTLGTANQHAEPGASLLGGSHHGPQQPESELEWPEAKFLDAKELPMPGNKHRGIGAKWTWLDETPRFCDLCIHTFQRTRAFESPNVLPRVRVFQVICSFAMLLPVKEENVYHTYFFVDAMRAERTLVVSGGAS
jgi:hypothetical protein